MKRNPASWKSFAYNDLGVGESFTVDFRSANSMNPLSRRAEKALGRKFSGETLTEDRGDGFGKRLFCRITRIA